MRLDEIIVTFASLFGMALTYWFFLMKKEQVVEAQGTIDIVVNGGYSPDTISIPKGRSTILTFIRNDVSSCLDEVVLPDFSIRKFLPLHEKVSIEITPKKLGKFDFRCGMNMFHGTLIVH